MRTLLRWIIRTVVMLIGLILLLAVVGILLKDVIAKSLTERNLRNGTGMDAKIEKMEVGLATPTVNLEGLKLYNTPAFGGGTFLEMPELRIEYIPDEIRSGKLRLKTMRLHLAELHVVKDKNGKTNIEALEEETNRRTGGEKDKISSKGPKVGGIDKLFSDFDKLFGGIDTLYLTVDKLRITDLANPKNNREIDIGIKDEVGRDLRTVTQVNGWFALVALRLMLADPDAPNGLRSLLEGPKKQKRNR